MSELQLQWMQLLKLLCIVAFATLYGFGGMDGKWKRRIIGPLVLTGGIAGFSLWVDSFNWLLLSYALLLWPALSIGYGAEKTSEKIYKRTKAGLAYGAAALPIAYVSGAWTVFGLHIVLCLLSSVVLGVVTPTKSARAEESCIGFIIGFLPLMGMI